MPTEKPANPERAEGLVGHAVDPDNPADADEWAERRSDARRNHERVLAAAQAAFTEHGLQATIPQIAARAGVGKATVYRSYPTKSDLFAAVSQLHVSWLHDHTAAAAEQARRGRADLALNDLLGRLASRMATDRLFVEVLTRSDSLEQQIEAVGDFEAILAAGRQQGTLRADVSTMDVQVLVRGFAQVLMTLGVQDPAVWARYTNLTLAALRPPGEPLHTHPTHQQMADQ